VLAEDEPLPINAKTYCVHEYPDWRRQADDIEAELTSRGETFTRIAWQRRALMLRSTNPHL
jgi:hypothetical protein